MNPLVRAVLTPALAGGVAVQPHDPVPRIPLCTGLTIVTAIDRPEGDYESIKTVVDAGDRENRIAYSAQVPTGAVRSVTEMKRTVLRHDLGTATMYLHCFHSNGPIVIPGSTALGASTAIIRAFKRGGRSSTICTSTSTAPCSAGNRSRRYVRLPKS